MFGFYPCQFNSNSMGVFFWHEIRATEPSRARSKTKTNKIFTIFYTLLNKKK